MIGNACKAIRAVSHRPDSIADVTCLLRSPQSPTADKSEVSTASTPVRCHRKRRRNSSNACPARSRHWRANAWVALEPTRTSLVGTGCTERWWGNLQSCARYPQLLVDESQDLGTLHQAILELLIKAGVHVSLIGDVNQGIYGFAGADGSFLSTYYNRAGVKDFKLTRNYRSLPPIISIANSLCGREDEADREPENGGAYFVGYKDSELPKLFESFKAQIDDLGMQYQDAVILSRGTERAAVLSGKAAPPRSRYGRSFHRSSIGPRPARPLSRLLQACVPSGGGFDG